MAKHRIGVSPGGSGTYSQGSRIGDLGEYVNLIHVQAAGIWQPAPDRRRSSVIGAGSVVLHDVPDHVVAAGSPARVIRSTPVEVGVKVQRDQ
ncbi:hypothetical protein CJ178_30235 [Rhodococcus sp. ACPA4]|nr:hypothetical protein CJ178_30235 [Rhodococcus sp. ACPA4]